MSVGPVCSVYGPLTTLLEKLGDGPGKTLKFQKGSRTAESHFKSTGVKLVPTGFPFMGNENTHFRKKANDKLKFVKECFH